MSTLPNMGIVLPTLGSDRGTWDDKLNAGLALVDAHDHTPGKGVQIPVAGININDDFAMGGFAVTGLGSLAFNAVTALTTGSKRLFVNVADNELYWRSNGGTNVKLTDGSTINTSLIGGIAGDYSSVGAEIAYSDSGDVYTFKQQSGTWARVASGPVRIYEFNTSETVYVELAVASALASSYTLTLPAALPASQTMMQVSAAGIVSFSNTLAANADVTLSGTGTFKHGEKTITQAILAGNVVSTGTVTTSGGVIGVIMDASSVVYALIQGLPNHARIKSVQVRLPSAPSGNVTYTIAAATKSGAWVDTAVTTTDATDLPTLTGNVTLDSTKVYAVHITVGATTGCIPAILVITYDVP